MQYIHTLFYTFLAVISTVWVVAGDALLFALGVVKYAPFSKHALFAFSYTYRLSALILGLALILIVEYLSHGIDVDSRGVLLLARRLVWAIVLASIASLSSLQLLRTVQSFTAHINFNLILDAIGIVILSACKILILLYCLRLVKWLITQPKPSR